MFKACLFVHLETIFAIFQFKNQHNLQLIFAHRSHHRWPVSVQMTHFPCFATFLIVDLVEKKVGYEVRKYIVEHPMLVMIDMPYTNYLNLKVKLIFCSFIPSEEIIYTGSKEVSGIFATLGVKVLGIKQWDREFTNCWRD